MTTRKAAVSVRVGAADVRDLKKIARRLGVRDSDVFRYAIKSSLVQLAPLTDPDVRGRDLLPVFIEGGPGLLRFFEIDVAKLGEIVNAGLENAELQVATEDLTLLSMSDIQEPYALVRLGDLLATGGSLPVQKDGLLDLLREYLYGKYAFRGPRRLAAT